MEFGRPQTGGVIRFLSSLFFDVVILSFFKQRLVSFFEKHPILFFAAAVVYALSPFDVVPEALLGPAGFIDDVLVLALPFVLKSLTRKKTSMEKKT